MYNMRALSGDFNNCPTQSVAYGLTFNIKPCQKAPKQAICQRVDL